MRGTGRIPDSAQRLPKTKAAFAYARRLHAGQSRKADGAPFIFHPREVATLLYGAGAPDHLIAAGESRLRKRRLAHYQRCLALLQERLPDSPLVGLLGAELENLGIASAHAFTAHD